jgi:hypothetical protein
MGETLLTARGAAVAIEARAGAPGPWKRLDLMRNDRVERTFDGDGRAEIEISATVGPFDGDTALWLRGESEAGERFWTTPVWVSVP